MARPSYRVQRKVATSNIVAGQFDTRDLPRGYDMESLLFRIAGSLQVTVAATSVRAEAPCQLVPRVQVLADGKNALFNGPFWALSLGRYDRNLPASGARATTPPSAVGIATYAVEAIGILDFMTPDGLRPKDSNFRTSKLTLFQAQLSFGQPGDPFVGGTVNFSGTPTVDISSVETVELPDASGNFTTPLALRKVTWQRVAVPASNPQFEIRLPAGNNIKSVLARGEGSVTAGEPSSGVINNLQLAAGVDVRCNLGGANLRAKNNADYGQVPTGYYIADVTGKSDAPINLTELWDVTGQTEPKAVFDVTGGANNFIDAIITEYILAQA
jgi:hypothetical protein